MVLRIDKLRFRNVLVRGDVLEAPAIEFAEALDDTFQEQLNGVATKDDIRDVNNNIRSAILEIKSDAAEREARISRNQLVTVGLILGGIAFAVAILLGLLL